MTLGRLLRFRYRDPKPPKTTLVVDEEGAGLTLRLTEAPREPQAEPARVLPIERKDSE